MDLHQHDTTALFILFLMTYFLLNQPYPKTCQPNSYMLQRWHIKAAGHDTVMSNPHFICSEKSTRSMQLTNRTNQVK